MREWKESDERERERWAGGAILLYAGVGGGDGFEVWPTK